MECEDGVIILEEKPSEEFEPTEEEVRNYAEWLGMDPEADGDLMYLAREGLKAPLTDGWKPCQNAEGEIFYFNFETGQSSWDHPADETYRNLVQDKKREKGEEGGSRSKAVPMPTRPRGGGGTGNGAKRPTVHQPRFTCFRRFPCCRRRSPPHLDPSALL
uniref:WW domain-containing protein n=1 Tax=Alexandrium catenella TaxID=2925 RepID=A0A7S1R620_ALECA|mmetsp:Transcript_45532/g.122495  ORF Transcript_45532/g.122495 Transcript_45532/m.122495 type:complete len:160 (+) Transcript_45532:67-546(+)